MSSRAHRQLTPVVSSGKDPEAGAGEAERVQGGFDLIVESFLKTLRILKILIQMLMCLSGSLLLRKMRRGCGWSVRAKECASALSIAQPWSFRGRGYFQVTSEPPAELTHCRAARPQGESPPAAFKGSSSALRGGLLSRLRPLCPGLGSTGGSGWTLRGC